MEEALTRILTPRRRIDILREVRQAQQEQRPYSIVFVGVNGVGKSTSLAKVCSWLQQNGLKVMIAACDTFRSGAVEQLQVHARNLDVELYSQGYGKDPSAIAAAALSHGTRSLRHTRTLTHSLVLETMCLPYFRSNNDIYISILSFLSSFIHS
jgi:signal recognition particle receptor subunit alpha